ncbi:DNA-binding transcriptional regulator [Puniceicoccaceae bacterium K14]|nr:DNA-binding transcriptional regulator [Puniceicoccaceae bacterium K14]
MKGRPKVALLIESSNTYARDLLHGIRAWLRDNEAWSIRLTEHGRGANPPSWLKNWQGDGIIARVENKFIANTLKATGLPVVDVSAALRNPPFDRVATDSEAATQLAFEHLKERGLTQFAYCGDSRFQWSLQRQKYFANIVKFSGYECLDYTSPQDARIPEREFDALINWLKRLPKPVGILACYDIRGQQILEACQQEGIRVPDEVAVIGVHNDELLCDLCDPPLSSVIPNARQAGYKAAEILSLLMVDKLRKKTLQTLMIEPIGVASRQSTDLIAIDDEKISQAIRFIRNEAEKGISVADVLQAVPMSRTLLERKFKKTLGTTPHSYINKIRIQKIKTLITTTQLPISEIADRCGYEHIEYLSVAFKRETGLSPTEFRSAHKTQPTR